MHIRMSASHRSRYFLLGALAACVLALASSAQTLSPDEVRITSGPYRLHSQILRAQSHLVFVEVVVRDSHGQAIGGLTKEDFALFDSGHPRDATEFLAESSNTVLPSSSSTKASAPSATPGGLGTVKELAGPGRSIALFFDDINTPPGDLGRARIAATRFIREAGSAGDRIALFTSSGGQILGFTSDTDAILKSMATVQSHPRLPPEGLKACPRMTAYEAYQIVQKDPVTMQAKTVEACSCDSEGACDPNFLSRVTPGELLNLGVGDRGLSTIAYGVVSQAQATWDQARLVAQMTLNGLRGAVSQLEQVPGKRVLLLASSGFISGDLGTQEDEITNEALHAGVVIDSLDSKGLYAETPGRPLSEISIDVPDITMFYEARTLGDTLESKDAAMANFAESTGGLLFRNNNDLDFGFRELGLAPAYAYELGFVPEEDGKYHEIKVKVRNAGHDFIQARPGYFAPTKETEEASAPTAEEKIDAEVRGSEEKSDFPLSIGEQTRIANNGARELSVQTRVDIHAMPFAQQQDRHVDMLTFVAALFDAQGKMVAGKEAQMDLALKPETFERFSKSGIDGGMSLEAPPGAYRLRVVVEEALHGEMSAVSRNVRIQ